MTIADRIKNRREELGLTQTDLAHKIGLKGKSSIAEIESRENRITLKTISKIAEALDCTETYLMGYIDTPMPIKKDVHVDMDYLYKDENFSAIIEMCKGKSESELAYIRKLVEVAVSSMK